MSSPETKLDVNDVLFIKTSSLGDVVHHMPALTEAKARHPRARFFWVVEDVYAPLVALHPAVSKVLTVAGRSWRRVLHHAETWREIAALRRALRVHRFDTVIDSQGLLKSAVVARLARGRRHGFDRRSIREPIAAWLYDKRHAVAWNEHSVARNRALTGKALGYTPQGAPDFGLDRSAIAAVPAAPYGLLLHGTARADKEWPEVNWRILAAALGAEIDLVVPFGTEAERERAGRIAQASSRARLPDAMPLDEMARLIAGASFVVGLDSGLAHLAAALGVPLVAVFTASDPALTGPLGRGPLAVLGGDGASPAVGDVVDALRTMKVLG